MVTTAADRTIEPGTVEYFEARYAEAAGDPTQLPWIDRRPNPALVTWLNVIAPSLLRCGARVCVVGCGLGDDARELMRRGYDVIAFDCSPTAIRWAQSLDPMNKAAYVVADLFDMPPRWQHRFDLVVEINTLQSLPPDHRENAMQPMEKLVTKHGHLLVICREAAHPVSFEDGPPWEITKQELLAMAEAAGLAPSEEISRFEDDETPPVRRMRALFQRR